MAKPTTVEKAPASAPAGQEPGDLRPPIDLRLDGGYIVARCGESFAVYELVWENRHGEGRKRLVLRPCDPVPRQFEAEAYRAGGG